MRGWRGTAGMLAVLSACSDLPLETAAEVEQNVAPEPVATVTAASCDRYWTTAVSGSWTDSQRWSPSGVPGFSEVVCFEANGSYLIGVPNGQSIGDLVVGEGVDVTLNSTSAISLNADALSIGRTSQLTISGCLALSLANPADVAGTLTMRPLSCATRPISRFSSMDVDGLLQLYDDAHVTGWAGVTSTGEIRVNGAATLAVDLTLAGGVVTGAGRLTLLGDLDWNGGALRPRAADGKAVILVHNNSLRLGSTSVTGAVDMLADSSCCYSVAGNIGRDVDVGVAGDRQIALEPAANTSIYRIIGRLTSNGSDTVVVDSYVDIVNTGTIAALTGELLVTAPTLDNRGSIEVDSSLRLGSSRIDNRGAIGVATGGRFALSYSDFISHPAGSMTGRLELLTLAELHGVGNVGDVVAIGSQTVITPGTAASPIGTLRMQSLSLGQGSKVLLDVAGETHGSHDRIHAASSLSYDGELEVRTVAPFVGGLCGQSIPLIHLADTTKSPIRSFRYLTGMQQTQKAEWRPSYAPHGLRLAGFDPTVVLAFSTHRVSVNEGGDTAGVLACLGRDAPAKSVSFSLTTGADQVTAEPAPLRFDPMDWTAPKTVSVEAIDDAIAEGPHAVPLRFTASSGDSRYHGALATGLTADITDDDPAVDLNLTLVSAPAAAALDQAVEARFRVTNAGPGASSGSSFTFSPLAGLAYTGNSAGATCTTAGTQVTCAVAALASAAQVEFTIVFRTQSTGTHVNHGLITGNEYDHDATGNTVQWSLTVN